MKKIILLIAISAIFSQAQSQSWNLSGNAGTNTATNFIGTTDNKALKFRTSNAVRMTMTSGGKIGIGTTSPVFKLDVKAGSINTDSLYRIGGQVIFHSKGIKSLFAGINSGLSNADEENTAFGYEAGMSLTTGFQNTAVGSEAMRSNQSSYDNTAIGAKSLRNSWNGSFNSGLGAYSLEGNTTGSFNTACGYSTMGKNTSGEQNTASGYDALYWNSSGSYNTAYGTEALKWTTTSQKNTAVGYRAQYYNTGSYNTMLGSNSGNSNGTFPSNFTALGYDAGHLGNNSNTIEIGNTSVSWIGGNVGWSLYSDKRIKDNIQSNVPGLSFITKLNPVTYNLNIQRQNEMCGINDTNEWEGKYDIEKIVQTGFLAQEVERAAKECNYDFNGVQAPTGNAKLYSVQYSAFVMPLVKAVQELNEEVIRHKTQDARQKSEIETLKSQNEMIISVLSDEQQQKLKNLFEAKSPSRRGSGGTEQNSPNPFSEKTTISYSTSKNSQHAELKIYSSDGRELKSFKIFEKGAGQIEIDGSTLAAGIYNYTLFIDGKATDSKQMILTK